MIRTRRTSASEIFRGSFPEDRLIAIGNHVINPANSRASLSEFSSRIDDRRQLRKNDRAQQLRPERRRQRRFLTRTPKRRSRTLRWGGNSVALRRRRSLFRRHGALPLELEHSSVSSAPLFEGEALQAARLHHLYRSDRVDQNRIRERLNSVQLLRNLIHFDS